MYMYVYIYVHIHTNKLDTMCINKLYIFIHVHIMNNTYIQICKHTISMNTVNTHVKIGMCIYLYMYTHIRHKMYDIYKQIFMHII